MHQPSIIYVSLLRTGSRSIRTALFPDGATSDEAPCYWNRSAQEIREDFEGKGWDWNASFKFSVVRNPWDRLVSAYEFWKPRAGTKLGLESEARRLSFDTWIRELVAQEDPASRGLLEQGPQLHDQEGALLVDETLRFETLREDWTRLRKRLPIAPLAHTHRTVHRHYSRYYTPTLRALVQAASSKDILDFGFRFERLDALALVTDEARFQAARAKARLREGGRGLWRRIS